MQQIDILTIFPTVVRAYLEQGITGRAMRQDLLQVSLYDLRDYTTDRHRSTDDYPYGGGAGMVMKAPPFFEAMDAVTAARGCKPHTLLMTPQGATLDQSRVRELAARSSIAIICGHYEGMDERVAQGLADEEISIGDYVLMGGELPALVIVEAMARLLPGVLGSAEAHLEESHYAGLLEYPQYTRPASCRGLDVPELLLSGDHARVERWRRREALRRTLERRPEMLLEAELSEADGRILCELLAERSAARRSDGGEL